MIIQKAIENPKEAKAVLKDFLEETILQEEQKLDIEKCLNKKILLKRWDGSGVFLINSISSNTTSIV